MSATAGRSALAVTHPSHELRVYGWLEQERPRVYVFTDGSGRRQLPRLPASATLLRRLGATPGPIFGAVSDLQVYAAILSGDVQFFLRFAEVLAEDLARTRTERLVGDAAEGHNSAHDMWRGVLDAAVDIAAHRFDWSVQNYDFTLFGHPSECPDRVRDVAIWVSLDDQQFGRKVEAVAGYSPKLAAEVDTILRGELLKGANRFSEPALALAAATEAGIGLDELARFPDLWAEIKTLVTGIELDAFRQECLRPAVPFHQLDDALTRPFYEAYGERLVMAGHYEQVIRYREHLRPLLVALRGWRDQPTAATSPRGGATPLPAL
jgi:hypothetical protein